MEKKLISLKSDLNNVDKFVSQKVNLPLQVIFLKETRCTETQNDTGRTGI